MVTLYRGDWYQGESVVIDGPQYIDFTATYQSYGRWNDQVGSMIIVRKDSTSPIAITGAWHRVAVSNDQIS